jgi:hypothetical protein
VSTSEERSRQLREITEVREASGLSAQRLATALNLLEQTGAVLVDAEGRFTRGEGRRRGPVAHAVTLAERRRELVRSRIERVRAYAATTDCRRRLLLGHFGEQHPEVCGRCDNCDAGTSREVDTDAVEGGRRGRGAAPGVGRGRGDDHRGRPVTVLFAEHGYKTSPWTRCGSATCCDRLPAAPAGRSTGCASENSVIVVTGASSGIGRATAVELARAGRSWCSWPGARRPRRGGPASAGARGCWWHRPTSPTPPPVERVPSGPWPSSGGSTGG